MTEKLFAAIRRAKVKPGMAGEFDKRVAAGALPVMKQMDGFKGYYLIAGAKTQSSRYRCSQTKPSPTLPRRR
jgi:heme-degrading monooxygenase HmoA